jgi:hypothetical protein
VLPDEVRRVSRQIGDEWVIPFPQVLAAIEAASNAEIAVVGVDIHEADEGARWVALSTYDFDARTEWTSFVAKNREAARTFVQQNTASEGYGYILTAASQDELRAAQSLKNS